MKNKTILFTVILAILLMQVEMIRLIVSYPVYGIKVNQDNNGNWKISSVDHAVTNNPLNLKIGDIVTKVDNQDVNQHKTLTLKSLEQFKSIEIFRNGKRISLSSSDIPTISKVDYKSITGEIISFSIAAMVLLLIKKTNSSVLLSLVFISIGITFMNISSSARADVLSNIIISSSLISIPSVFLHFLIVFFDEKGNITFKPIKLRYIYLLSIIYTFSSLGCLFLNSINFLLEYSNALNFTGFIIEVLFIFYLLAKVYLKYRAKPTYESLLIKTILLTLCISFLPLITLSILPSILSTTKSSIIDPAYTGLCVMFFPASFAYLIGSKQLYDISLVLRRIVFSAVLSILPSAIITIVLKLLVHKISVETLIIQFILILLILTFVLYSLEYFLIKLEPIMFPKKHYLQKALKKISKNLTTVSSFIELKSIILMDLVGTLQVFGGAVVLRFQNEIEIISEGAINESEVVNIIKNQIEEHSYYSIFPINQHEEYETFLVMTRKRNNSMLSLEDSQWLNLIITYLAVSLENIHLIRKLTIKLQHLVSNLPTEEMAKEINWFRKLLFQLQEKERVRIATDLHDTTIQDLYFLKRRLMDVIDEYTFQSEDQQKINHILEYIEIMNTNLRNSCFELNPYLLKEIGLVDTIQKLIDHEKMISDFSIDYFPMSPEKIESLSLDAKHHIFRIIQELINNAKKHSQAKSLFFELDVSKEYFDLQYEDDGVGFDSTQIEIKEIGGHGIGLEQMRSRIYSLNGSFELNTAHGKGVKIAISFPLKEGRIA